MCDENFSIRHTRVTSASHWKHTLLSKVNTAIPTIDIMDDGQVIKCCPLANRNT